MKINSKETKQAYFDKTISNDGSFFQVSYPTGESELVFVKKFHHWNGQNNHWYLEAPTHLISTDLDANSLEPFYDEEDGIMFYPYQDCYLLNNKAYAIDALQTEPFLPEVFDIEFVADNDKEAAEYLLNQQSNN